MGNLTTPKRITRSCRCVYHESEGGSWLSLLRPVRQDQPRGIFWRACLCQCRSSKGAPERGQPGLCGHRRVIEVERWLAELALALRQEDTCIPTGADQTCSHEKANGKLGPLGISTVGSGLHDGSDAGAGADLAKADLPPEIYAYRAGRNAPAGRRRGGGAAAFPWPSGRRWAPTSRTTSGAFTIPTF